MSIPGSASPLFFTAAADAAAAGPIKSVRFNSADSAYLNRTPSSAGNRKTFTLSGWIKRSSFGVQRGVFSTYAGTHPTTALVFSASHELWFFDYNSSYNFQLITSAVFRDPSAWLHFVIAVDTTQATASDRVKIYINGEQVTDFSTSTYPSQDFQLDWNSATEHNIGKHSRNFDGYFADFYFIDGQAKEATDFGAFDDSGVWQAAAYSGTFGTNGFHLFDFANESGIGDDSSGNDNDWTVNNLTPITTLNTTGVTTTVPEDLTGDWFGILNVTPTDTNGPVAVFPDGSGVSNTRGTFFWSGLTSGDTITWYGTSSGQNRQVTGDVDESTVDVPGGTLGSFTLTVNAASGSAKIDFNGSANCYGITPGVTTSLPFDVLFDVPTNGNSSDDTGAGGELSSNYCTFNPLGSVLTYASFSNGNLDHVGSNNASHFSFASGTIAFDSADTTGFYFEVTQTTYGQYSTIGLHDVAYQLSAATTGAAIGSGATNGPMGITYDNTGTVYNFGTSISSQPTYAAGDVIGVAVKGNKIWFAKNNSWISGNPSTGTSPTATLSASKNLTPCITGYNSGEFSLNAGQREFSYDAPSGFKCLCTSNLPTPTIADGSDYFDAKLYTGNGSTQTISGLGFSPDLVWIKNRSQADNHKLLDTVRGATKELEGNTTDAEVTNTDGLTAFNSDGFDLGADDEYNTNTESYVTWTWDAGSSTVSNTDGTLTSSVRASQTAGTSIVTYTGSGSATSVGHGLGAAPDAIIVKNRSTAGYKWPVYHSGLPANASLALNITWAYTSISDYFDAPSSTVFNISSDADVNKSGDNFVAYCFSSVEGFSKFGTYAGNSNADGPFVYLGFKPALIIIKGYDFASNWFIHDYKRPGYNQNTGPLRMHAEVELTVTTYDLDILSNGFKMRTGGGDANQTSKNYAYFAWAENPFQANGGLAR